MFLMDDFFFFFGGGGGWLGGVLKKKKKKKRYRLLRFFQRMKCFYIWVFKFDPLYKKRKANRGYMLQD